MNDLSGTPSFESQVQVLAQRAAADGDDWRVKIGRAESPSGRVESLATFDACTVEMIANADTWIPPLFGGTGSSGLYYLYVTHAKDRAQGRTSAMLRLPALAGTPIPSNQIEWARIDSPGFPGPKTLIYPDPKAGTGTGVPGGHLAGQPSAPGAPSLYPSPYGNGRTPSPSIPTTPDAALAQIQREREQIAEERRRAEIESIKRENAEAQRRNEQHLAELRDLVKTVAQGATQRPPPVDVTELLAKGAAILTPIIAPFLASKREEAIRREEAEQRRIEREEQRRAEEQKRSDALMERIANQSSEQSKAQAALAEAHATSMRTMIQTVTSLMELGIGQRPTEDEGWGSIAKAFFSAMGEGMAARMSQPTAAALPPARTAPRAPAPAAAPSAPPSAANGSANGSFAGTPDGNEVTIVEKIAARIAERDPDVNGLSDTIIAAIQNDAVMQSALAEHDGNLINLFQSVLGDEWAQDQGNVQYATALMQLLGEKGRAAGLVQ